MYIPPRILAAYDMRDSGGRCPRGPGVSNSVPELSGHHVLPHPEDRAEVRTALAAQIGLSDLRVLISVFLLSQKSGGNHSIEPNPRAVIRQAELIGAMLFGWLTYQRFYESWAHRTDGNPFTAMMNGVDKYVVSGTLANPLP